MSWVLPPSPVFTQEKTVQQTSVTCPELLALQDAALSPSRFRPAHVPSGMQSRVQSPAVNAQQKRASPRKTEDETTGREGRQKASGEVDRGRGDNGVGWQENPKQPPHPPFAVPKTWQKSHDSASFKLLGNNHRQLEQPCPLTRCSDFTVNKTKLGYNIMK